jgi:hypothetical protein
MMPKYLYRRSDKARFTLQENGKYTMDDCRMVPKYEYSYKRLMHSNFVESPEECIEIFEPTKREEQFLNYIISEIQDKFDLRNLYD